MIIGHQRIWQFLNHSVASDRLAHAYLFIGPPEVGKKTVAQEFLKILQCSNPRGKKGLIACGQCQNCILIEQNRHPDTLLIEPVSQIDEEERKPIKIHEIKIEQIRQVQHKLALSPFSAKYKAVIIDSAENMNQEAQNCLLKTLEEPPLKSFLVLVSSDSSRLLKTIASRCQVIKFLPVGRGLINEGLNQLGLGGKELKIEQAAMLAGGRPGIAINLLRQPALWQEQVKTVSGLETLLKSDLIVKLKYAQKLAFDAGLARETLNQWIVWFRGQLLLATGAKGLSISDKHAPLYPIKKIIETIKNISQTRRLLAESGLNNRLIIENLLLKI